ncbi:MAG: hypothetical protein ACI8Y7_000524 [Candidatus Woesearchaeota archaeon]|jgi:hypothetical protein
MTRKGQTATEYIMIIGMIFVVILVVLSILQTPQRQGGDSADSASSIYWKSQQVSIIDAAVGTVDVFVLKNRHSGSIRLLTFNITELNGTQYQVTNNTFIMRSGEALSLTPYGVGGIGCLKEDFEYYDIDLCYEDIALDIETCISGDEKLLKILCN